jgi:type 1 fimbria pilin
MKKIVMILALLVVFSSSSFASALLFKGSTQSVSFESQPEGATVIIDGATACKTPCSVQIKKSSSQKIVRVELKGYKAATIPLGKSYDPVALLNVIWDLSTTDLTSGAAFEYKPNHYFIELKPE